MLLPALSAAKQKAWTTSCNSNLRQIYLGMRMFADENNEFFPRSGGTIYWNPASSGASTDGWMQQIYSNVGNTNVYNCPGNIQLPPQYRGPFNYFNGCNAAYIAARAFAAIKGTAIVFPSAFILGGDTAGTQGGPVLFDPLDADKDDYTQNCVGGAASPALTEYWEIHRKGQNLIFADGHARWYKGYSAGDMTFAYNVMTNWIQ